MSRAKWATPDDINPPTAMSVNVSRCGVQERKGNHPRGFFPSTGFGCSTFPAEVESWFGLVFTEGRD
jgi:hypothetical protein